MNGIEYPEYNIDMKITDTLLLIYYKIIPLNMIIKDDH